MQLPNGLLDAVIWQESRGNPRAVSPAGAMGLMQVMPDTARQPGFGIRPLADPFNAGDNKRFGTEYLGALLKRYKGDIPRALAGYNWGPGNADKWNGDVASLPTETQDYIAKITSRLPASTEKPAQATTAKKAPEMLGLMNIAPASTAAPAMAQKQGQGGGLLGINRNDLLSLGAGLLSGSNWSEGIGSGLQAIAFNRAQREEDERMAQARDQMLAAAPNLTPQQKAALSAMPASEAAKVLGQQAFKDRGVVRGADGYNYYQDNGERVLPGVSRPVEDNRTSAQREYETAVQQGFNGTFLDYQTNLKRAGATSVNVGAEETSYGKEMGKQFAAQNVSAYESAQKSRTAISNLDRLEKALSDPGVYQGSGGASVQSLKRLAQSVGIDVEGVSSGEVAESIANQMALQLRDPSTGAGMPGAMSDADRAFLQNMVAGLSKTPEGNRQIIDAMRKIHKRNIEIDKIRRDYIRKNGRFDEGLLDEIAAYADKNQIFGGKTLGGQQKQRFRFNPQTGDIE